MTMKYCHSCEISRNICIRKQQKFREIRIQKQQVSDLFLPQLKMFCFSPLTELEEELHGATNGWHNGSQLFACADRKAIFVPITHLTPDKRFESSRNSAVFTENSHPHLTNGSSNGHSGLHGEFGDMDCPVVPGFHAPIKIDDLMVFCGRNRGIQGHQNSCYLDATLFAMFSFTRYK